VYKVPKNAVPLAGRLVTVALALGHRAQVEDVGKLTYRVTCTCGYENAQRRRKRAVASESAARAFEAEAERYVDAHLERMVREARSSGAVRVSAGGRLIVQTASGEVLI
jgi:hypothetical protein